MLFKSTVKDTHTGERERERENREKQLVYMQMIQEQQKHDKLIYRLVCTVHEIFPDKTFLAFHDLCCLTGIPR